MEESQGLVVAALGKQPGGLLERKRQPSANHAAQVSVAIAVLTPEVLCEGETRMGISVMGVFIIGVMGLGSLTGAVALFLEIFEG
jgi:hypothetical protein